MWLQKEISLKPKSRGFHLITDEILVALGDIKVNIGILHLFIKHSSASLSINENADPSVRHDFENFFNRAVPENQVYYTHTDEGPDDLPAHIKASLLGSSVSLPITRSQLNMGIWQGIYLCEHRNHASSRHLVATISGD
jgi:secondary thiamine-phosphate synthase enzyme